VRAATVVLAGLVAAGVRPRGTTAQRTTVTITNRSDWEIHHLFLSPADTDEWGPDQLGEVVIAPGGAVHAQQHPVRQL